MERKGLKTARKRANLTQEAIADAMGVSVPQVSRWETGKDGIPSSRLRSLQTAYRANLDELLGGEEAAEDPAVPIELLPTHVGAGGGGTGFGDYRSVAIARTIVQSLRAEPEDLLAIEIEGDSMAPTFLSGDMLLIDKRKTSVAQPGAFCLWDGDGYVVKYLEKVHGSDPPTLRVISENSRYRESERLVEEVRIMGRVAWLSRKM